MKEEPSKNEDGTGDDYSELKQQEAPPVKKSCWTFNVLRRTVRIGVLLGILIVMTLIPILVIALMYTYKEVSITTDRPLKFVLRDCKLYIAESAELAKDKIKISISLPGNNYDTNYGSTNEIVVKSQSTFTEACVIDMQINPEASLPGLEVSCIGTCYVTHMGPHALDLGSNSLLITGETLHFMSVKLIAGSVQAVVGKGNLHIYSLTIPSGSGTHYMTTGEGDVVVQSVNSMHVSWTQPETNLCFFAPQIASLGNTVLNCNASVNLGTSVSTCSGTYVLCKSGVSCGSSTSAPTMIMTTLVGNVYANVIISDGNPVDDSYNSVRGWNYTDGVYFDSVLDKTITGIVENINGSAQADPTIWIALGNSHTFSSASMTYLLVNNMAYLDAYPWWISFFSGSLLLGRVQRIEGNLAPGLCPFKPLPTTEDLYKVRSLILSRFNVLSARAEAAYVYGSEFPTIKSSVQSGTGFRGTESALKLFALQISGGQYELKAYGLKGSLSLMLAVIISLILAVITGIVIFYVFLIALDKLLDHFLQQYKHINAYSQRMKQEEPSESLNVKADQVADVHANKNKPDIEEKRSLIVSVFGRLPSQYMLIDIMVGELKRLMTDSVEEFCAVLFEKQAPDDVDDFQPMMLNDIREVFEQYCFLKQFPEQDLLSAANQQRFIDKGFIFKQQGREIENLIKIRWLKEEEKVSAAISVSDSESKDSSVNAFFKSNCVTTPFPADTIQFEAFKKAYSEFCEEKRLPEAVLTRAQLHDGFGIESINEVPYYLIRAQRNAESQLYKVNLDKVKKANQHTIEANSDRPQPIAKEGIKTMLSGVKGYGTFIFDIISVALHLVCLLLLGCIPFILPLFIELEISSYTMSDYRYKMKYDDFQKAPWNIYYKLGYLSGGTIAAFCIGGFYIFMGLIELIVYYRYMSFETLSLKSIQKMEFSLISRVINAIEWTYICIIIGFVAMYIALVGVWSILGTILNPNAYLAYGAAAVTLVSFIGTKIAEFQKMNFLGIQALQDMLFNKLQGLLDDIMKKVLAQAGFATDSGSGKDGGDQGGIFGRAERAIRATSIGKAMVSVGMDPTNVVAVLRGDEDALVEMGVKQGVPKSIMKLLLAMIKSKGIEGRKNEIIACIQELASSPQLMIDPEIISVAIETITNPSELNIPVIITNLSKAFFSIAYKQIVPAKLKDGDDDGMAYLEVCKQIFPRVITALRSFRMEDLDSFLDQYESINEFLYDSVKKRSSALTTTANKAFGKLFNEKGEPIFALPAYILKAIRIFNLVAVGDEGKLDDSKIQGITSAVFYIMENFFGTDRKVTSMLNMLLASTPEKLISMSGKGTMPIEEQEAVLKNLCEILGAPPTLVSLAWKAWTGNFTIDDSLVKEVCKFSSGMLGVTYSETTTKIALQVFSIVSTRLSKGTLLQDAMKFGVDFNVANIVDLFGTGKLTQEQYKAITHNMIFEAISNKLHIPANQALGVIALIKGDFNNEYVIELFDSLRKRWNIPNFPSKYITAILSFFLSNDVSELINACEKLNFSPPELLLVGKKLLHPANVSDKVFETLGLSKDNANVACRKFIQVNNPNSWNEWVHNMVKLLSAEFRPVKAPIPVPSIPPPTVKPASEATSGAGAAENKGADTKREEEKGLPDKEKTTDNPKVAPIAVPEPVAVEEVQQPISSSKTVGSFTGPEKEARGAARLLISISEAVVNEATIQELLEKSDLVGVKKELTLVCNVIVTLVRSIKGLREGLTEKKVKDAANQIADLLNIDVTALNDVLGFLLLRSQKDMINGLLHLIPRTMSKHESNEIIEYCTFLLDKSKVLKSVENAIAGLADQLKIPRFLVTMVLSPFVDEASSKISLEEFMMLLDQAGFNAEALTSLGIKFQWPGEGEITIERVRYYLSGLVLGNSGIIKDLLINMGVPEQIFELAYALTSDNKSEMMEVLLGSLTPVLKKCGVPEKAFCTLLELYKFLAGMGNAPALENDFGATTGYDYLKKKIGVLPTALVCLQALIERDTSKLVDELPNLVKEFNDFDRIPDAMKIKPQIISGLMTIIIANNKSLENMAESMHVKQELIELCLKITSITKGGEEGIASRLMEFIQSPIIAKVWSTLGIPSDTIEAFLILTFRRYNMEFPNRLLQRLNMAQHVDIPFYQFLMTLTNSYATLQSPSTKPITRDAEIRQGEITNLKKYMTPVCKRLRVDVDLALISVRLRQGDFYIIEDYQDYLNILLPNANVRKMAMGVCGFFTLPIQFTRKFGEYPEKFTHSLTFESACEMICEMLNINPIVPRMMMLDDEALNLIESKFGFSRKALTWLMITLTNLPIFMLEGMALKEFKRMIHLKKLELEEVLREMEKQEARIDAETKPAEVKKETPPPADAINTLPPAPPTGGDPLLQPPPAVPPTVPAEGQPSDPAPAPAPQDSTSPATGAPAPGPTAEQIEAAKSTESAKMKKLLKIMRSTMMSKVKGENGENYYDKINFDDPLYENTDNLTYSHDSLSHLYEVLEVILFNNEKYAKMDYDYITANNKREGSFMVSDERILELFGTRAEYYTAMAKTFFCNPNDPSIWLNKETLNLSKTWAHKDDRGVRKNVWAEIKKVLRAISNDPGLIDGGKHHYDSITLGQLSLFMLLIRLRKRLNSSYDIKRDNSFYSLFCLESEYLGVLLESMTMMKGLFGSNFSRIRFYKVLSLALNANIGNTVEHRIVPSIYSKAIYHQFKKTYDNKKDLQASLDYCNNFVPNMCMGTDLKLINYLSFSEYTSLVVQPNDILDADTVANNSSPYCYEKYNDGKETFEYKPNADDPFIKFIGEEEIPKRVKASVKSVELLSDAFKSATEDPVSGQATSDVFEFLQFIENTMVVEQEKLDFFLDLALIHWDAFDKYLPVLKSAGFIKNENTPGIYKAMVGGASLRKSILEWKGEYITKKVPFTSGAMNALFPYLLKRINEPLIQAIVLLAHGVITPATIKDLAAKYGLDQDLVQGFFISGYPSELLKNREELQTFVEPLLRKLGIVNEKQCELIFSLVDIYNGKLEGWEELAEYCCFSGKKNAQVIFKCLLQLVNWEKLKSLKDDVSRVSISSCLSADLPQQIHRILMFLVENELGKQIKMKNETILDVIWIIDGVLKQDLRQIFAHLRAVREGFGLQDNKYIDLIEVFIFVTNKYNVADPDSRKEMILRSVDVLSDWLMSLISGDDPEKKKQFCETLNQLLRLVLGAINMDKSILKSGLEKFVPMISGLSKMWEYFKSVKETILTKDIPLKQVNADTLVAMFRVFGKVLEIGDTLVKMKKELTDAVEKEKKELRTPNISLDSYKTMKSMIGRGWEHIKSFNDGMSAIMSDVDAIIKTKIEIIPDFELEENAKTSIQVAMEKLEQVMPNWNSYKPILLLLSNDPVLILDHMKTLPGAPKEVIDILMTIMKLLSMNEESFKNIVNAPAELKSYVDLLSKYFISPIIKYIKVIIDKRIKSTANPFELSILKRADEYLGKPDLLTQLVMLLHYVRYGLLRKQTITDIIMSLFNTLKSSLSGSLQEFFPKIITALSGFSGDKSKTESVSIVARKTMFLRTFVQMCIPDLYPRIDLIEKLAELAARLFKIGGSKEQLLEGSQSLAEEMGQLLGISTEIIHGIFGIMNGDIKAMIDFSAPVCKLDEKVMATVQRVLEGGSKCFNSVTNEDSKKGKVVDDVERSKWLAITKKVTEGETGIRELFQLVDMEGDKSGGISITEFMMLMKKMNMPMTEHRVAEIFARCKSKHSKEPNELDVQEFEDAIKYVQSKRVLEGLYLLGISTNQLIFLFIILTIILVLLFVFIFLGIVAFSMGGTFGSIVNSILPVGAGFAVGQKSPIDFKDAEWTKRLKDVADEVIHMIGG